MDTAAVPTPCLRRGWLSLAVQNANTVQNLVSTGTCALQCVEKSPEVVEVSSSAQAIQTVQAMNFAA